MAVERDDPPTTGAESGKVLEFRQPGQAAETAKVIAGFNHKISKIQQDIASVELVGKSLGLIQDANNETPEETFSRMFYRRSELVISPTKWLIDGILPRNATGVLAGESGAFKSFLALHWGLTLAQKGLKVALLAFEGSEGIAARIRGFELEYNDGNPIPDENFVQAKLPIFPGEELQRRELIKALGAWNPDLILMDTLARSLGGLNENDTKDMGIYIRAIDEIRNATRATNLLVHHLNKQGNYRGSTRIFADVDTFLELERPKDDGLPKSEVQIKLLCKKQKDAEAFAPLYFSAATVTLDVDDETGNPLTTRVIREVQKKPEERILELNQTQQNALLVLLQEKTAWKSAEEIRASASGKMPKDVKAVRVALQKLEFEKLVCKTETKLSNGKVAHYWQITPAGISYLQPNGQLMRVPE